MRVDKTLETKPLSSLRCTGPVKQKRALLESNPPRDSWTEGDEMNVSTSGEAQTSPDAAMESFISEPSHALKTHPKNKLKISLSQYPFFRSKRIPSGFRRHGSKAQDCWIARSSDCWR
jgi:hypothetical protein